MTDKNKMPIIFVGHGSPMNAIEDNSFTKNFHKVVSGIPKPKAIICISAHWVTKGIKITAMDNPKTIHDFYGFPKELYDIEYPAMGDVSLANRIKKLFSPVFPKPGFSLIPVEGLTIGETISDAPVVVPTRTL